MSDIAIDIVLLPPPEIIERCYALNENLRKNYSGDLVLAPGKGMPHISLFMGCIAKKDVTQVCEKLNSISLQHTPLPLIGKIRNYAGVGGQKLSEIFVEKTPALLQLFSDIQKEVLAISHHKPTSDMLHGKNIAPLTLQWIAGYVNKCQDHSLFNPHITLGYGELEEQEFSFVASTLAIYQLGNWCTCQKELFSLQLHK